MLRVEFLAQQQSRAWLLLLALSPKFPDENPRGSLKRLTGGAALVVLGHHLQGIRRVLLVRFYVRECP